jgi:apolipoprotein N-acyltransferase
LLAGFWTITEWMRSWVFTGFAWNPLGAVTVPLGVLPMASTLIGTYGLSLLIILGAGGLLLLWQRCWIAGLALVVPFALAAIVPATSIPAPADTETLITVIQPNIEQQDKWQAGVEEANFAKMARLTERKDPAPRLIFWPEAAIPDYLEAGYPRRYYYGRDVAQVRGELAALMQPGDILVLGGLKLEFGRDREGGPIKAIGARNSVFAMDQQQKLLGSYDKAHLVPYGEYLPMRPVLSALGLSRLAPGDLDFWPGPGPRTLDLGQRTAMGIQVCYEIIFSGEVVDKDNRPGFIFNPSNDAWFGAWGPPQHLAQARLRAIEEGLPVIRSTPTGISAVIDARGQVRAGVPMAQSGRIDTVLPSPLTATPFALWGNILPLLLAAITIISAIAIGRQRR